MSNSSLPGPLRNGWHMQPPAIGPYNVGNGATVPPFVKGHDVPRPKNASTKMAKWRPQARVIFEQRDMFHGAFIEVILKDLPFLVIPCPPARVPLRNKWAVPPQKNTNARDARRPQGS